MNKEWADKWVAALRSGEYKQTTKGRLRDSIGFCCLGVLCEITNTPSVCLAPHKNMIHPTDVYVYEGLTQSLPKSVMEKTGIATSEGGLRVNGLSFTPAGETSSFLSGFNDSGKSFVEIADIIEQHWEKL